LSIEYGIFTAEEYAPALEGRPIETFVDLGCNAGWFALWLAARQPDSRILGLMVDAHPRMVVEASWHVRRNGLDCVVVHGAVGMPPGQGSVRFHVHPSSSASSVLPYEPGRQLPVKGSIAEINVPAISVGSEWRSKFRERTVDLMKIDIEGKELDFVTYEAMFLQRHVRRTIVEWHKWCVSLPQLGSKLASIGFELRGVYNERETAGIALYENHAELE
jgi:FkbM family methyltransferase